MHQTDRDIVAELEGRLHRGDIRGVSIDSRTIAPGELFVALRGERFDGHDYVAAALRRGAAGAVVERAALKARAEAFGGLANLHPVEDTLRSLQELALAHRRRHAVPLAAVTGSNGKTTTKEMLASILAGRGPVLKNSGNLNNHIGVPLSLLRMNATHRAAVIEMGMSGFGEIDLLARLALPDVGVITNIGPAHLEQLKSTDGVARAKGELLTAMRPDGTAVLNADDRYFETLKARYPGTVVSFGMERAADVRATDVRLSADGADLLLHAAGAAVPIRLAVPGRHNVANALAAAAAALAMHADLEAVRAGLESFRPLSLRSEVRVVRGITILADYYNANPASMHAALDTFASLRRAPGRLIAVLGDMRELGEAGPEAHRAAGAEAARAGIDLLIVVGSLAEHIAAGARNSGMDQSRVLVADSTSSAAAMLREQARAGDAVLVKGSRGMKMETVLEGF